MAQQWLGQQELRRGDMEMANYYLRCASASSEEEYSSLRLPPSRSASLNIQNNVNSYPFIWDASSIIPPYPQPT